MLTGKFRASYAHVFTPQVPPGGGDAKYRITMLIPKSDVATYNTIMAEINKAIQEGIPTKFGGQAPPRPRLPIFDGDGLKESGEPFGEECRGHWVLRASSPARPSVVDQNVQTILDPNAFYSGCYARATVDFFAYNTNGNKGIACGLNNIQKLADGEPFSGRSTAEEDFGGGNAYTGGGIPAGYPQNYGQPAPAQQSYTQPAYQAPVQQGYQPPAYTQPAAPVMPRGYGQPVPTQQPYQAPAQPPYQAPTQPPYQAPTQQPYQAPAQQPYQAPTQQPYQQPMPGGYPPVQQQATAVDPITGMPTVPGGVMGI